MNRWVPAIVDTLAEAKRHGIDFGAAWALAIHQHPPRLIELGVLRGHQDDLLDQTAAGTLEWFRAVCEAAYEDRPAPDGSPSRMRGLRAALEVEFSAGAESWQRGVRVAPKRSVAA